MTQTAIMDSRLQARISSRPELAVALLQQILPPSSAVVVGANRLNPAWLNWPGLTADRILLIDAQSERLQAIHQHLPHTRGWRSCAALLDAADGNVKFHTVSHANESGLLADAALQALWPNIRSVSTTERQAQRLDTLLAETEAIQLSDETSGWLVIESLPAVRILRGAQLHLQRCSTVALRVLVGKAAEAGIEGATLAEARAELEPLGFRHAFSLEETHPDILTAVFVREPVMGGQPDVAAPELTADPAALDEILQECEALREQVAELERERTSAQEQLSALERERAELSERCAALEANPESAQTRIQELENQVAALIEERGDLTHAWENDVRAKEEAFAARDAERMATTEAMKAREQALAMLQKTEAELAASKKEKMELQAGRDEAQKQLEQLQAEQVAATQAHEEELAKLTQERDEARKQLADQSERMQQLETENAEAHRRHQLMQDEMVKAEAQIELIKDLLLREQGA